MITAHTFGEETLIVFHYTTSAALIVTSDGVTRMVPASIEPEVIGTGILYLGATEWQLFSCSTFLSIRAPLTTRQS